MEGDHGYARISTEGLSPGEARAYWADHVCEACLAVECDFNNDSPFEAAVEYANFGAGRITHFLLDGHKARRTPRHIAKDQLDGFIISYILQGNGLLSRQNKEIMWKKGGVYITHVGDRFVLNMDEEFEFTAIYFEPTWLRAILPEPADLTLKELSSTSGWGRALAAILPELQPRSLNQLALPSSVVTEHIATLLALSAGSAVGLLRNSRQTLLERLRRDMRDRLSDSSLDTTGFAHAHGISVRTLHAVFAAAGTSFTADLISMRLERARTLLEDRRFDNTTIIEIAGLVGFSNANHFSVRFRKAYGLPPTTYRMNRGR